MPAEPHLVGENPITKRIARIGRTYPRHPVTESPAVPEAQPSTARYEDGNADIPRLTRTKKRRPTITPVELTKEQQQGILDERQRKAWLARLLKRMRTWATGRRAER